MSAEEDRNCANNGNTTCVVCYRDVEIYSIGLCEHPVCYECSTRMRVLCQQNECPICRQDLPKVVFTRTVKPFRHLRRTNLFDTRYNIYFDSLDIQERFTMLLVHVCSICKEQQVFGSFNGLKDHMRKQHELHYCDLCVENLRIFSHERRCYTRPNLGQHRRKGDPDDKSHKGHPLCQFCDQRYMDNDELFRHLRRDHLYCHFCDADGYHHYYDSYNDLRDHYRDEHYLCEDGDCHEEMFTSVFRTDIDLKAHKASTHGKHLGKAAAKQARTLELEFTLAPRSGDNRNNRSRHPGVGPSTASANEIRHPGGSSQPPSRRPREQNSREHGTRDYQSETTDYGCPSQNSAPYETEVATSYARQPDVRSTEEFPSLGTSASPILQNFGQTRGRGNLTIRGTLKPQTLAITDENFPALGPESINQPSTTGNNNNNHSHTGSTSKTVNFSLFSGKKSDSTSQRPQSAAPNVSIHLNHKSDGTVTTRVTAPNLRIRPTQRSSMDCDFPALGRSNVVSGPPSTSNTGQWTKVTCVKSLPNPVVEGKTKKSGNSGFVELPPPPPSSTNDFPSLARPTSSKKSLSIAVLPKQSTWRPPTTADNASAKVTAVDATKGKAKKKKIKQQQQQQSSGNNSSGNESGSTKINPTAKKDAEKTKKSTNESRKNGMTSDNLKKRETEATNVTKSLNSLMINETKKDRRKETSSSSSGAPISDITCKSTMENSRGVANDATNAHASTRKRSELKIDSLNTTTTTSNNNHRTNDDNSTSKNVKFVDNNKTTVPPPGFSSTTQPPPGFAVKLENHGNKITTTMENPLLTFTNSSGVSYEILPNKRINDQTNYRGDYVAPLDFHKRNKNLVAKVTEVLAHQDAIQEFRYISGLFRQGDCPADDYYKHCRTAMGLTAFQHLFTEILVLLPDIVKQRELFEIHKKEVNGKIRNLEICEICGQVLKMGDDVDAHRTSHSMENHFPALGNSSGSMNTANWVGRRGA